MTVIWPVAGEMAKKGLPLGMEYAMPPEQKKNKRTFTCHLDLKPIKSINQRIKITSETWWKKGVSFFLL